MSVFKSLYQYRELLRTSVKKEIRGKYKGAWLGVLWSYLNPLFMLIVYSFVFSKIMKIQIENYTLFLFVALLPWNFFTTAISQGTLSVVNNGSLMKKVFFPREIIPISSVTASTINFLFSTIIIFVFIIVSGLGFSIHVLWFPLILFVQYLLIMGITFITSALTVYARDLEHIISIILLSAFYATPIVYSIDMIPKEFLIISKLNPMSYIIDSYRMILFYKKSPDINGILTVFGISVFLMLFGYLLFKKLEKSFVEEL